MAKSANLLSAEKEVKALRAHFLPKRFDITGTYPNPLRVQAQTRAFVVLVHAEVETYLEIWAKDICQAAERLWNSSQKVSTPLAFLLITLGLKISTATLSPKDTPQRMLEECVALFQRYYKQIKDNHGIKEANVLPLFGAIGTPASAFGATLLPALDSFGELRGTQAHYATRAVINVLDPETEFKRALDLLREIEPLDTWFQSYLQSIV